METGACEPHRKRTAEIRLVFVAASAYRGGIRKLGRRAMYSSADVRENANPPEYGYPFGVMDPRRVIDGRNSRYRHLICVRANVPNRQAWGKLRPPIRLPSSCDEIWPTIRYPRMGGGRRDAFSGVIETRAPQVTCHRGGIPP